MRYKVRDEVEVYKQIDGYLLKDIGNNNFVKIKEKEYEIYKLFKTERSLEELEELEKAIVEALISVGIICEVGKKVEIKKKFNIFNFKLAEFDISKLLKKITVLNKVIFSKSFKITSIIVVLLSIVSAIYLQYIGKRLFSFQTYNIKYSYEFFVVYLGIIGAVAIHELGHILTMVHYNYDVKNIGLRMYLLQLLVYCDLSDLYISEKKNEKIKIYSAGIIAQIILTSLAICIYTAILLMTEIDLRVLLCFATLNFIGALINIIPLVKFDGYWILTTIIGIYNLDSKSYNELLKLFSRKSFNKYLATFAILSIIFKIYLVSSTIFILNGYIH